MARPLSSSAVAAAASAAPALSPAAPPAPAPASSAVVESSSSSSSSSGGWGAWAGRALLTATAVAAVGAVAYAVYFDYRRRNDPEFRRHLRTRPSPSKGARRRGARTERVGGLNARAGWGPAQAPWTAKTASSRPSSAR